MLIKNKELVKKKLDVYFDHFSYFQLQGFEDAIYTDKFDKTKRAALELMRLEKMIQHNREFCYQYYQIYSKMKRLMKVAYFDPTVLDEIYITILAIHLDNNMNIRLYSGLPLLKEKIDLGLFS